MKITATGGTDAASLVIFWPEHFPDGADELLEDDPVPLLEQLRDNGKLVWFVCDSDGEYTAAIFVDEEIPADLLAHCHDEQRMPRLIVRGPGYFGGSEYMYKFEPKLLEEYPGMCQQLELPAGTYSARIYRTGIPDQQYEAWLLAHAGPRAKRIWELQTTLVGLSIALVLAVFVSWLFVEWVAWYVIGAAAAISIFAAMGISRTAAYQAVTRARAEFKTAFPNYVVWLESMK